MDKCDWTYVSMVIGKYKRPSFLNTHPVKGHLHRRRSQTVRKALDFIEVLLVKNNLAGDFIRRRLKSDYLEEYVETKKPTYGIYFIIISSKASSPR